MADFVLDLDESLSGSDPSESEEEGGNGSRKDTTLSALLRKQAAISGEIQDIDDELTSKKRRVGPGKPPLIWFSTSALPPNTYLGIYRALFARSEQESETMIVDIINRKQLSPRAAPKSLPDSQAGVPTQENIGPHIFLCMIGGGHFAAMVVSLAPKQTKHSNSGPLSRETTVIVHKTFHRYTTRRKQGGAQSSNDAAKGAAHSAGADLRRYNEQALTDEVRLLLSTWKPLIDTSELLFVRATGITNRRTLFGPYDGQVLRQNDTRVRGFPFTTRRATQNELMRAFVELTRVKVQEIDEAAIAAAAAETETIKQAKAAKANKLPTPTVKKRSEEEETALLNTTQIQALVRRSKLPALLSYIKSNGLSADFHFYPQDSQQNQYAPTALHLAASLNSSALVVGLLTKSNASPLVLNRDSKLPFDLSTDRSTRDAFRVARHILGERYCDWDSAHVPAALSSAEASERESHEKKEAARKEEERRKAESERLDIEGPKVDEKGPLGKAAERARMIALGHVGKTAQEKREEEAKGLTPEMRMRLERERRARAAEERMRKLQSDN